MKFLKYFLLFALVIQINCSRRLIAEKHAPEKAKNALMDTVIALKADDAVSGLDANGNTQIFSDSVYGDKKYKIVLSHYSDEKSYFENDYNSVFHLSELKNGSYQEIYRDTIQQHFEEVLFEDFTNDGIPEILVENISDVSSNLTYYLYKLDPENSKITKLKGFEIIKNPVFLPKYNLITNLVMSGRNWSCFYEIQDNKIIEYEWCANQGEDENGNESYDEEYDAAIVNILELRKKRIATE